MVPRLLRPAFTCLTYGFMPLHWIAAAAGIAVSLYGASQSAAAGEEAAEAAQDAYEFDAELKLGAVRAQTESILARKDEEFDATVARMSEVTRQAMIARGRLAAGAGESGVAGSSVAQVFMSSFFEEARARGQEIYNLDKKNEQANRDIRAAQSGLQVGQKPGDYDSTADYLKFASSALSIADSAGWLDF